MAQMQSQLKVNQLEIASREHIDCCASGQDHGLSGAPEPGPCDGATVCGPDSRL